jgi:hypothetical protein
LKHLAVLVRLQSNSRKQLPLANKQLEKLQGRVGRHITALKAAKRQRADALARTQREKERRIKAVEQRNTAIVNTRRIGRRRMELLEKQLHKAHKPDRDAVLEISRARYNLDRRRKRMQQMKEREEKIRTDARTEAQQALSEVLQSLI